MASFATLHGLNGSLLRSQFLGQDGYQLTHHHHHHFPLRHPNSNKPSFEQLQPHAKFNLLEIMGGRGLCNGEKGLQQELERQVIQSQQQQQQQQPQTQPASSGKDQEGNLDDSGNSLVAVPEDAFEKEMMGLTGGFPGGEKGLQKFIEENPPSKQGTVVNLSARKEEAKAIG